MSTVLPDKATSEEARQCSSLHARIAWLRFLDITKEVAREERELYKKQNDGRELQWGKLEYNKKYELLKQINDTMEKEQMPSVDISLVAWRMVRTIGALKYTEAGKAAIGNAESVVTGSVTSAPVTVVEVPRPLDPVRDV